jgi:hypothetical protein
MRYYPLHSEAKAFLSLGVSVGVSVGSSDGDCVGVTVGANVGACVCAPRRLRVVLCCVSACGRFARASMHASMHARTDEGVGVGGMVGTAVVLVEFAMVGTAVAFVALVLELPPGDLVGTSVKRVGTAVGESVAKYVMVQTY